MGLAATLYVGGSDQRNAERIDVDVGATVRAGGIACDAQIMVLSATGCLIACDRRFSPGDDLSIGVPGIGIVASRVVRVVDDRFACEFFQPVSAAQIDRVPDADTVVPWRHTATTARQTTEYRLPPAGRVAFAAFAASLCWALIYLGYRIVT